MIYLNVAIHVKVFARVTQAAVLNQGSASVNCLMEKQTKTFEKIIVKTYPIGKLNLAWWFGFRLKPIYVTNPAAP